MVGVDQTDVSTLVDLAKYMLLDSEKSYCPNSKCSKKAVHLLMPRDPSLELPLYYLCQTCGRIAQIGKGEIAPACQ